MKISFLRNVIFGLASLLMSTQARAQFTAFNDHYTGPGTHPNATAWNVYGVTGGAPGNAGPLKDINSGAILGATITITNLSVGGGTTAGAPNANTPAYNIFNGFIDWGNATVNHAVQTAAGQVVTRIFSGLDPNKRYRYTATAVRAGGYTDRWIRIALLDAQSFTASHTAGCLTSSTPGASVSANEVALSSGDNTAGDMAVWENIQPSPSGTFAVMCTQYQGPVPNGSSAGIYGYSIAAEKLEEINLTQSPAVVTNSPSNQTVQERGTASFTVGIGGNPTPTIQWYRVGSGALANQTNRTYTISQALVGDNNASFFAVASNYVTNISYVVTSAPAALTVLADTNAPTVISVFSGGATAVQVTFSEPVTAATATNIANYSITNGLGVLQITNAMLSADATNLTLYTFPQTIGSNYNITISGVRDISAAANMLVTTQLTFLAQNFGITDVGAPGTPGSIAVLPNGFDVTGSGTGIAGTSDQMTMATQPKTGDFDVKVRVASLTVADAWSQAALIAREGSAANGAFAASIATPNMVGSYFASRSAAGGSVTMNGTFPSSYPNTWLRLRRVGNVFTGFAGIDGTTWVQLGSATLSLGAVNLGFAVSSHTNVITARGQFRDFADAGTNAQVVTSMAFASEPIAACSRATQIAFSEIMYKPGALYGTNNTEYLEIYNSNPFYEDISGYRISGVIDYTFPAGTIIGGNQFLVIAKNPTAVQNYYGITGVLGPYVGTLPAEGTLRLRNEYNGVLLDLTYKNSYPWPAGADETGHSLVLSRASYGEADYRAWGVSAFRGGSPGKDEPLKMNSGLNAVFINEFLANSDAPAFDYIELYNHSSQPVDISGCWLSDNPNTNKFQIPTNTVLPAGGFIVFYETNTVVFSQTNSGIALSSSGEGIYLRSPDQQRMIDAIKFDAQEAGVATGRSPDGGTEFYRLVAQTPGTNNAAIRVDDIVINEIMFAPISGSTDDQYVEIYNKGTNPVSLAKWRFVSGIDYTFPAGAMISPGGYVVVAKNVTNMLARYANLNSGNTFGDFDGKLKKTDRVALAKYIVELATNGPIVTTNTLRVVVDEVSYRPGGHWGQWANEGGSSLELIDPRSNHRMAQNWGDSDETQKAPWTKFEATGRLDNGSTFSGGIDRLELYMLDAGECLLDEVYISYVSGGVTNLLTIQNNGFESGSLSPWVAQGDHVNTRIENSGYAGTKSMHIVASGGGDAGPNRIRIAIPATLVDQQTNVTIRGVARWQRGWPELLLRLKGNFMEAYCNMVVPQNLGTPGLANSRALANNAPAIAEVYPTPILPQANEPAVVTARVHDPNGLQSVSLYYRNDTASGAYVVLPMNDSGTNGDLLARDGIYSATIPGQASGTMIAFYVEARDVLNATSTFPENAVTQQREAMLRFGDPVPTASFATYRLWLSTANINTWVNRPAGSNQGVDGTFVVNNYRVIYNAMGRYGGSPYHQGQNTSPVSGSVHYVEDMPEDDMYLGTTRFNKIHAPGNGAFDDTSLIREQISFWFVRKMKLPYLYRRYVAFYCNGNRKGGANALMEDSQRPGAEMIDEYFPEENDGWLYKEQPWFEWDDVTVTGGGAAGFTNKRWCQLTTFYSTNNAHKLAAYRQTWLARTSGNPKNDYNPIFALCTAATLPTSAPAYWQNIDGLIDVDQWTRTIAVEHAVGNWDSFGNRNSQNLYGYKPTFGKWKQMIWDYNIVLGNSGSDGPGVNLFQMNTVDPSFVALENYAPFRRAWLRGYKMLTAGPNAPMLSNNVYSVIDARYNAIIANGITPGTPSSAVKTFIDSARSAIATTVASSDVANFSIANSLINASSNLVTLSGSAPLDVTEIRINGQMYPVTWTSVTGWTISVPVTNSTQLGVSAIDYNGNQLSSNNVTINYSAPVADPSKFIVINEIMYNPLAANAEYVEIFNTHSNIAFDMSGWVLKGVDYTFPAGSYIAPRSFLLLTKDRTSFANAYGGTIPVFGVYDGTLQGRGEYLSLVKPGNPEVVINRVRYEGVLPWPTGANGTGSSLQLVDLTQENSRVANWSARYTPPVYTAAISTPAQTNDGWRFVQRSANFGTSDKLIIYPDNAGTLWLDDFSLVTGTNAGVGTNFIRGGDFTDPVAFSDPAIWGLGTNMNVSYLTNDAARPGGDGSSMRMVAPFAGSASVTNRDIVHVISPTPGNTVPCTLSFWYFATNSTIQNLTVRILGSSFLITTNIGVFYIPSNYVPPQLLVAAVTSTTPGATNAGVTNLPAFQSLWINELQADNTTGIADNFGEREPWIEIYNSGTNTVSLDGLYLSTNYTSLTNYVFPNGITLAPHEFRIIWCDGQTNQDAGTNIHANFRLPSGSGSIALSRLYNGVPQVLDYVNYQNLFQNRSYGSFPDGQPFDRQEFFFVTARGTNNGASAPLTVFINEWMASNTNNLADPADADFEDWFELYNPGNAPVVLSGYYLTDSGTNALGVVTNKFQFKITTNMAHVIPAHGYLLVWADNETGQNMSGGVPRTDMHVNFSLAKGGEFIGLFAADGTTIDFVSFGAQSDDVSRGRYPDGSSFITNFSSSVSPRSANYLPGVVNAQPSLGFIGNKQVYYGSTLSFTATATDSDVPAQSLTFSLDGDAPLTANISPSGFFTWTPEGIGTFPATVRVTDSGIPQMSDSETISITVLAPPQFTSTSKNGSNLELTWGTTPGFAYRVEYKDDLNEPSWITLTILNATGNTLSITNGTTNPPVRFYRVRVQ